MENFDRLEKNIKATRFVRRLHEAIEFAKKVWNHSLQFYGVGIELLDWLNPSRDNPMGYVFKGEKHLRNGQKKLVCVKVINVEKIREIDRQKRDHYERIHRNVRLGGDPVQIFFDRELGALMRSSMKHNLNTVMIDDIVTKYEDFEGEMIDFPYYVMEYIDGFDLSRILKEQEPFDLQATVNYIIQVCNALKDIHSEGYIYQDLSPSNIMITSDRKLVKLIDFGTLREYSEDTATFYGKSGYSAPETTESLMKIAFTMDIFPLGVIFYECLMGLGKQPYGQPGNFVLPYAQYKTASTDLERVRIRQRYEEPWKDVVSRRKRADEIIPPNVFDIIFKCIAIDPEDRYKDGDNSGIPKLLEDLKKLFSISIETSEAIKKYGIGYQVFNGNNNMDLKLQKPIEIQALNKSCSKIEVLVEDLTILSTTFRFDGHDTGAYPDLRFEVDAKEASQVLIEGIPDDATKLDIVYRSGKEETFELQDCLKTSKGITIPKLEGFVIALNYNNKNINLSDVEGDMCVMLSREINSAKIIVYSDKLKRDGEMTKIWEGCIGTHVKIPSQKYQEAVKAEIKGENWETVRNKFFEAYEESGETNEYALFKYIYVNIKLIEVMIENRDTLSEAYNLYDKLHSKIKAFQNMWRPDPTQLKLLLILGTMHIQSEEYHKALEFFNEFDELYSDLDDGSEDNTLLLTVKNNTAVCLIKQWEKFHDSESLKNAKIILKKQLENLQITERITAILCNNLATACCYSGDIEEAKNWCEMAIKNDNSYPEPYNTMSIIYEAMGNVEIANIFKEKTSKIFKEV